MGQVTHRPDSRQGIATVVLLLVGLVSALFGIWALASPENFFVNIPGLPTSGLFHEHLVRDAGLAFLSSGALMCLGALRRSAELAFAGCVFPVLHAAFHFFVWIDRGCVVDRITVFDFAIVVLPAALAAAAVFAVQGRSRAVQQ